MDSPMDKDPLSAAKVDLIDRRRCCLEGGIDDARPKGLEPLTF
jgi:hypothetical protein